MLLCCSAAHNLVAEWIVEGDRIHDVLVPLQRQHLLARQRVPHLARPIVRAGDEAVAALVESAVGERQDVRAQDLEEVKVLGRLGHIDLLDAA